MLKGEERKYFQTFLVKRRPNEGYVTGPIPQSRARISEVVVHHFEASFRAALFQIFQEAGRDGEVVADCD